MPSADLRSGERNEAVRDLQRRLASHGYDLGADEPGFFGSATDAALRAFQDARGLRVDGVCGRQTWSALVESGRKLGDRMLYLRTPMLRGDDVRALQRHMNSLGFDAGREDGILGEETSHALREFQRNAGIPVDGICGPTTLDALSRLSTLAEGSVAAVRERELMRQGRPLTERRVLVTVTPELAVLGETATRELRDRGADALLDAGGSDDGALALEANRFGADVCLAIRTGTEPATVIAYFGTPDFRSELGYRVARSLQEETSSLGTASCVAKTYPLLRETRMATVLCELDPTPDGMAHVVARAGDLGKAFAGAVRRAIEEPAETT